MLRSKHPYHQSLVVAFPGSPVLLLGISCPGVGLSRAIFLPEGKSQQPGGHTGALKYSSLVSKHPSCSCFLGHSNPVASWIIVSASTVLPGEAKEVARLGRRRALAGGMDYLPWSNLIRYGRSWVLCHKWRQPAGPLQTKPHTDATGNQHLGKCPHPSPRGREELHTASEPPGLMWPDQSTGPSSLPSPGLLSPLPRQTDGQGAGSVGQGSEDPHTLQGVWGEVCTVPHMADAFPRVRGAALQCQTLWDRTPTQSRANTSLP